jgi:hypothetical protein
MDNQLHIVVHIEAEKGTIPENALHLPSAESVGNSDGQMTTDHNRLFDHHRDNSPRDEMLSEIVVNMDEIG